MRLIGIYIDHHDNEENVIKNLKENWYPFGHFSNCKIVDTDTIIQEINKNKAFINKLYNIDQENSSGPSINLNCIVGKNGSGKSTVLALLYRIINNLACKLKEVLPNYNIDFEPQWAWGFNASLYYEINGQIGIIEIYNNKKEQFKENNNFNEKRTTDLPVKLIFTGKDVLKESVDKNNTFITNLGNYLFYTVGTNYSLYSNIVVRNEFESTQEDWLKNLYHKNDGYFTPIVLVPYRENSAIIDTEKELKLANERVNTLSILLKATDDSDFIDNFSIDKVIYKLKSKEEYEREIINKTAKFLCDEDLDKKVDSFKNLNDFINARFKINGATPFIYKIWDDLLKTKNKIKNDTIYQNIINYLVYKTIKMSKYYDKYKNFFETDILSDYDIDIFNFEEETKWTKNVTDFINFIFNDKIDFTNLKVKQCINFLENGNIYLDNQKNLFENNELEIKKITDSLNDNRNLNYDTVFINLLPPIFYRQYLYENAITHDKNIPISSMSSGQQQMLFSLSYAVYHMKNAASNQKESDNSKEDKEKEVYSIPYRNMNLIFDEAELYYHPEFQRQFVEKLLDILKRGHFEKEIDSINITIVTHSPFMLSDIYSPCITALEKGKIKTFDEKTLGANIYDMLTNHFFMDSCIGSQVEKVINEILLDFNEFKIGKFKKEEAKIKYENSFYSTFVDNIGDDYLYTVLTDLIDKMKGDTFNKRKIKELNKMIKELENEEN